VDFYAFCLDLSCFQLCRDVPFRRDACEFLCFCLACSLRFISLLSLLYLNDSQIPFISLLSSALLLILLVYCTIDESSIVLLCKNHVENHEFSHIAPLSSSYPASCSASTIFKRPRLFDRTYTSEAPQTHQPIAMCLRAFRRVLCPHCYTPIGTQWLRRCAGPMYQCHYPPDVPEARSVYGEVCERCRVETLQVEVAALERALCLLVLGFLVN
jgi:hypothetical protein